MTHWYKLTGSFYSHYSCHSSCFKNSTFFHFPLFYLFQGCRLHTDRGNCNCSPPASSFFADIYHFSFPVIVNMTKLSHFINLLSDSYPFVYLPLFYVYRVLFLQPLLISDVLLLYLFFLQYLYLSPYQ